MFVKNRFQAIYLFIDVEFYVLLIYVYTNTVRYILLKCTVMSLKYL